MRSHTLVSFLCFASLAACSDNGLLVGRDEFLEIGEGGASACKAAGGQCVLGNVSCAEQAPSADQDCNPDRNPGGSFCCLSRPTSDASVGSVCEAAGGQCVLGSVSCAEQAPSADQDCNPDRNPGGSFCCLSKSTSEGGACTWPPAAKSTKGCVPQPEFKVCEGSNCRDACTAADYALTCTGSPAVPTPPASLDCKVLPIPTPSDETIYCCPCAE
jgi:hypothetical protein